MKLLINIPDVMMEPIKRLRVDHYPGLDSKALWSQVVAKHTPMILSPDFRSITSQIEDENFYKTNYQEDFPLNDEHNDFFKTAKGLKITRAATKSAANGKAVRNNNGAVMREILFLELISRGYMKLGDNNKIVILNLPAKLETKSKDK